jgi:hypothetical protein
VGRDATERGLRETFSAGRRELAAYLAAGAVYVGVGVALPEFLFAWAVALGYLVLCLVVLPAVVRRLR